MTAEMDSYEYYLLYHKDSSSFINALARDNSEIIKALEKLISNEKLIYEREKTEVFQKIWSFMQDHDLNGEFDKIFDSLLTSERIENIKNWTIFNLKNLESSQTLHVAMIIVKKIASDSSSSSFLLELSSILVDLLLKESPHHSKVLQILNFILVKNPPTRCEILNSLVLKCQGRNDRHASQCLCNFFEKICEDGIDINVNEMLQKFFQTSDLIAQKQGIFIVKTLVHRKQFHPNDEESFKKFTIILEALEENQSHLILPALTLVNNLYFSEDFKDFRFILVQKILNHENSLIKNWGLKYVLSCKNHDFSDNEFVTILSALNATYLYDPDLKPINLVTLRDFISTNFEGVFRNLIKVNWVSVACYRILIIIADCVTFFNPEVLKQQSFINILHKQTQTIPKQVKNMVIRSGVQSVFAEIAGSLLVCGEFQSLVPVLIEIFNINSNSKCLEKLFKLIQPQDYDSIFDNIHPDSFIKSALLSLLDNVPLHELKLASKNLRNSEVLLIETLGPLNRVQSHRFEDEINVLLSKVCDKISNKVETADFSEVSRHLESLEIGLVSMILPINNELQNRVVQVWKLLRSSEVHGKFDFHMLKLILKFNFELEISKIAQEIFDLSSERSGDMLLCKFYLLQTSPALQNSKISEFIESLKSFIDQCDLKDINIAFDIIKNLLQPSNQEEYRSFMEIAEMILAKIFSSDEKTEFVVQLTSLFLLLAENPSVDDHFNVTANLSLLLEKTNVNDKAKVFNLILKKIESSKVFDSEGILNEWLKQILLEKLLETEILTREQQIELMTSCEIEEKFQEIPKDHLTINGKTQLRLRAAQAISKKFADEFPEMIENYMETFAKASKKKPRYFPNSWIHRMKLHCLQPIVLCKRNLTERTIEILVAELLNMNNQLNVSILIEIILSRHYPSIVDYLKEHKVISGLKAPALKSLFAIAVMQLRMEDSFTLLAENFFGIAEMKLGTIHDLLIPFTMGQNYSVRSYAQAAIIILFKHVKSLFGARETQIMSKIDQTCKIIQESMKHKNASKFFEILKQDFRFCMKFDEIWTVESFYFFIPVASNMPSEEVTIIKGSSTSRFKIAEMENEIESLLMVEEISVPNVERSSATSVSLQQKYLPYKYRVPGDALIRTLPNIFGDSEGHLSLRPRSSLVVVASLIDRPPNLGGLARTCEIFGTENYVIDSLKLVENPEFKALSKTAEKWLKISEVRSWQLFDFLLGMKQQGYSIVGAEQSGKSVSLYDVQIPKKSVFLLGNEKEGIPADLLSLLDIIIEIPQQGVIRSLNVHVTGGIVIWEYTKQHLIK